MDRLSPVVILTALLAVSACDKKREPAASRGRFDAVAAKPTDKNAAAGMCDKHFPDDAPLFQWPKLTAGAPKPVKGWRWINVWATWCPPCVEEMPRLAEWQTRLAQAGAPTVLTLLSADTGDAEVEAFRKKHPEMPPSLRIADESALTGWLKELKIPDASLPIQVFVDGDNRIRCIRASAVDDSTYDDVLALLRSAVAR